MNIEKIPPIAFVGKWIDLSHPLMDDSLSWPGSPGFELESLYEGQTEEGNYLNINLIKCFEQCGTHMDAPQQMIENGIDVSEVSLSSLICEGVKIDISENARENPDYQLTIEDVTRFEKLHGTIPHHCSILISTGYAKYYPDKEKYWGIKKTTQQSQANLHFPGIHPDCAKWLISMRSPLAVGIDTSSVDHGQSKHPLSHLAFLGNDIVLFINIANMNDLPANGFLVVALPTKISGASSSPLRIVACIP